MKDQQKKSKYNQKEKRNRNMIEEVKTTINRNSSNLDEGDDDNAEQND